MKSMVTVSKTLSGVEFVATVNLNNITINYPIPLVTKSFNG